jgi:DNA-binding protein HU-beta
MPAVAQPKRNALYFETLRRHAMTKAELVDQVYQKAELSTKTKAEAVLDAAIGALRSAIAAGNTVTFTGFGSFKVMERAARKGRNPRTGKEITIPACKVVKFTPGKNLKESVR